MLLPSIINAAQICAHLGVQHVVLSPGSRSAPLTLALVRHPGITTKIISDERSAAFVGLGMAQQLRQAVALVCTSGSAAYNYAPAVAEAFFQQVPLIIFTADRPPEWIDQLDGQTIRQRGIYGVHVKASYEFPVGQTEADVRYAARQVAEAINLSRAYPAGPVHLNVPIREPFYPNDNEETRFDEDVRVIVPVLSRLILPEASMQALADDWQHYSRRLIVGGQDELDTDLISVLPEFGTAQQIPVVADVISNLHPVTSAVQHADVILARPDNTLAPDLLITFGRSVISKNLKLFLRSHRPAAHWHIQPAGTAADTFGALNRVIHTEPVWLFSQLQPLLTGPSASQADYYQNWQDRETEAQQQVDTLFSTNAAQPVGEFQALQTVLHHLPDAVNLHLANSMTVRYANLVGLSDQQYQVEVFANRGTSGIDGSNSTAVGAVLASDQLTVLLTGDMAFFYDRNAFWHNYLLPNLRVVLFNNHGGGIFRLINGPRQQPELEEYFETHQALTAECTARDFGMEYHQIDLTEAGTYALLPPYLTDFFYRTSGHAKLLEIVTNPHVNQTVFNNYREAVS